MYYERQLTNLLGSPQVVNVLALDLDHPGLRLELTALVVWGLSRVTVPVLAEHAGARTAAAQRIKVAAREAAQRCVDALGVAALASTSNSEREDLLAAQFELNRKLSAFSLTFNERLDDSIAAEMRRREGVSRVSTVCLLYTSPSPRDS